MFRHVLNLARKDLVLLRRDRLGLFWIFVFPLVFALFFGYLSGGSGSGGMKAIAVAVVDEDRSETARAFVLRLQKSEALKVSELPRTEAVSAVRRGDLVAYIAVPAGYGENGGLFWGEGPSLEVGLDPSRRAETGYLEGILMEAAYAGLMEQFTDPKRSKTEIDKALTSLNKEGGLPADQKQILRRFLGDLDQFMGKVEPQTMREGMGSAAARLKKVPITPDEEQGPRTAFEITFPAAILWGLVGCVISFAISIVTEKTGGTFLRLRIAPLTRGQILAGKGLACFLVSVAAASVLLLVGRLVFHVRIESVVSVALAVAATAFGFTGLMMLLATVGHTERAVAGAGWGTLMPLAMLGGGMIPLMFMPAWLQSAASISPFKWGILALEGAIWRGFSLPEMLLPCGVLIGFGVVCFALGVRLLSCSEG